VSSTSLLESPPSVAARPRVDVHPPYEVTLGPVAVDLARRGGLVLDRWQADALDVMCAIRPGGQWACFEYGEIVSRQNGKGAILEARALAGLFLFGEELIMWSAHEYKTAMEGFRRVLAVLRRLGTRLSDTLYDVDGVPVKVINTNGEESLERLDTGQRLRFIARSKGSGRGFSGDVNIIDEAFALTREQQEALMPTMSARPNPQIIYTSSPPLTGDTGDVLYALRQRADAGGDDSLGWRDWGLAGDLDDLAAVDLDDERLWYQANPALGGRLTVEYVRRERRSMSDVGFARERLGIWPRWTGGDVPQWQVLREADWAAALRPESQLYGRPAIGVYVPPDRSYAAIGLAGAAVGGGRHIEVAGDGETLDYRPGTAWVVPRLVALERHRPSVLVIDDRALADEAEGAGLVVHRASVADMVTGCQLLYDGISGADLAGRDVVHIGQPELTEAARGAVRRDIGGSWAWARRDLAVDITPLAAVSLALFGHCTPRVQRPAPARPRAVWV
jgi:Phage terminase-like protein, large subunit